MPSNNVSSTLAALAKVAGVPVTLWIPGGAVSGLIGTQKDVLESVASMLEQNGHDASSLRETGVREQEEGSIYLREPRLVGPFNHNPGASVATIRLSDVSAWHIGAAINSHS